jgi:CheY-like chemotaxis protein
MATAQPRILTADDQPDVVEALRLLLKSSGFTVIPTSSPAGVLGAVESRDVDVVLMDLNSPATPPPAARVWSCSAASSRSTPRFLF